MRTLGKVLVLALQPIPKFKGWIQISISLFAIFGIPVWTLLSQKIQIFPVSGALAGFLVILFLLMARAAHRLQTRLDTYEQSRPNIVVDGDRPYFDNRNFNITGHRPLFVARCLLVRFMNQPTTPRVPGRTARSVGARITFDCSDGNSFCMDGRWADTTQPAFLSPLQSRNELLRVDFAPGAGHELDIAMRPEGEVDWYAVNNDSFTTATIKDPKRKITGEVIVVEIKLLSDEIHEIFKFKLRNPGSSGDIELLQEDSDT